MFTHSSVEETRDYTRKLMYRVNPILSEYLCTRESLSGFFGNSQLIASIIFLGVSILLIFKTLPTVEDPTYIRLIGATILALSVLGYLIFRYSIKNFRKVQKLQEALRLQNVHRGIFNDYVTICRVYNILTEKSDVDSEILLGNKPHTTEIERVEANRLQVYCRSLEEPLRKLNAWADQHQADLDRLKC